jgi:hypothetical protein
MLKCIYCCLKGAKIRHASYFVLLLMYKWMGIQPFCINSTGWAAYHSDPVIYTLLSLIFLSILGSQSLLDFCSFHSSRYTKNALQHIAYPRCKPPVEQPSLCYAYFTQMNYSWSTLVTYYHLELSHGMTQPHQCCHSHNENIPMLWILSQSPLFNPYVSVRFEVFMIVKMWIVVL